MEIAKKIWDTFCTLVVVAAVLIAMSLVGVRLLGFQVFTVLSGSMEPVYSPGDLIYVKKIATEDIVPGTILTFMVNEDTVATHRVVGAVASETEPDLVRYRTKGDANNTADAPVDKTAVKGTVIAVVPKIGTLVDFIKTPLGTLIIVAAVVVLTELPYRREKQKDDDKRQQIIDEIRRLKDEK